MNDKLVFADSNIFLYLLDKDRSKKQIAAQILAGQPFISPQVVFENLNVVVRKFGFNRQQAVEHAQMLLQFCPLVLDSETTLERAFEIFQRHQLQVFDSRIIASALTARCEILYSEDFQHNQVFEGTLTIINPFLV